MRSLHLDSKTRAQNIHQNSSAPENRSLFFEPKNWDFFGSKNSHCRVQTAEDLGKRQWIKCHCT